MNDEHPREFLMKIVSLCNQYHDEMPEDVLVQKIRRGLKVSIVNSLYPVKPPKEWTV